MLKAQENGEAVLQEQRDQRSVADWEASMLCCPCRCGLGHMLEDEDVVQLVKTKVSTGEDGRGRFKTKSDKPTRISDREKKAALKT